MEVKMMEGFLVGEKIEAVKDVGVVYGASNVEIKIPRGATFRIVGERDDRCGVVLCDRYFSLKLEIAKETVAESFSVVKSFRVGELVEAESAVIFYEDAFTPVRFKKGEIVEVVNISRHEYLVKNGEDSFHWVDDDFVERNFRRIENSGVLQRDEKTILSGRTETETETNKQFKVGDRVQFKSWEEMEREFGLNESWNINMCPVVFSRHMNHLCDTYATIVSISDKEIKLKDFTAEGDLLWTYSTDMIKPAEDEPQ